MIDRRHLLAAFAALGVAGPAVAKTARKPVVLHTDIGGDVDDTFALLQLLRRPELDLKLVVTEGANAVYRGRLVAKLLTLAGRTDVAIAMGPDGRDDPGAQSDWIGDFKLSDYPVPVRTDAVEAIYETVFHSPRAATVISLGPATTLGDAVHKHTVIPYMAHFIGMFGSVRVGYDGKATPDAEYNVKTDPVALQRIFAGMWMSQSITPLDTCGQLVLDGADWKRLRTSRDPFARAVIANSEVWLPHAPWMAEGFDLTTHSSTLFDTVAITMAYDESDLVMETLPLSVTDTGMTVIDETYGTKIRVATGWTNMARFKRKLVADLTRET